MSEPTRFSDEFLEHAAACVSQYDHTHRRMARAILNERASVAALTQQLEEQKEYSRRYVEMTDKHLDTLTQQLADCRRALVSYAAADESDDGWGAVSADDLEQAGEQLALARSGAQEAGK